MQIRQSQSTAVRSFVSDETGGSLMEYTLIAALVVVVGALLILAVRKMTVPV